MYVHMIIKTESAHLYWIYPQLAPAKLDRRVSVLPALLIQLTHFFNRKNVQKKKQQQTHGTGLISLSIGGAGFTASQVKFFYGWNLTFNPRIYQNQN